MRGDPHAIVGAGALGVEIRALEARLSRLTGSSDAASYGEVLRLVGRLRTLRAEQTDLLRLDD